MKRLVSLIVVFALAMLLLPHFWNFVRRFPLLVENVVMGLPLSDWLGVVFPTALIVTLRQQYLLWDKRRSGIVE